MPDTHLSLRLSRELARALTRWARSRGLPKSEVVREAVSKYLAPAPETPGRTVTARELAARWRSLPHLNPEEAAGLADDVARGRAALEPVKPAWE